MVPISQVLATNSDHEAVLVPQSQGQLGFGFSRCHVLVSTVYWGLLAGPGNSREGPEGVTEIPHLEENLGIIKSNSSVLELRRLRLRKGRDFPRAMANPPPLGVQRLASNELLPPAQPLLDPRCQTPGTAFLMDPALPVSSPL